MGEGQAWERLPTSMGLAGGGGGGMLENAGNILKVVVVMVAQLRIYQNPELSHM